MGDGFLLGNSQYLQALASMTNAIESLPAAVVGFLPEIQVIV